MNIKEYLQYVFCTTTESMLSNRIKLAEALSTYQSETFEVEQNDLFESCVQKIISGEYDRYNFNDEDVKKLFRFSSTSKSELYQNLISLKPVRDYPQIPITSSLSNSMNMAIIWAMDSI